MNDFDFFKWIIVKDKINHSEKLNSFQEQELWWCNCGKNVGVEINGKDDQFLRPFIVFKKLSQYGFIGIPTTTREHKGSIWYKKFIINNINEYAVLSQVRLISTKRLHRKIAKIPDYDFFIIKSSFLNLLS